MAGGLDHAVIATRDLAALAATYGALGFQVGRRNAHPWGTHNHIVQFDGTFIELIGLGEGFVDPAPADAVAPFGGFLARYLDHNEGLAMLALRSADAAADRDRLVEAGIGIPKLLTFERRSEGQDGRDGTVGFSLAFARSGLTPDAGFFVCRQHAPALFWNPSAQVHENSARALIGVVMVADDPADHAEFLAAFTSRRAMVATSMGLSLDLPAGRLDVLTPAGFAFRYGAHAVPEGPRPGFAALRIAVDDMATTQVRLGGLAEAREGALVVPATTAGGVALSFEPAAA